MVSSNLTTSTVHYPSSCPNHYLANSICPMSTSLPSMTIANQRVWIVWVYAKRYQSLRRVVSHDATESRSERSIIGSNHLMMEKTSILRNCVHTHTSSNSDPQVISSMVNDAKLACFGLTLCSYNAHQNISRSRPIVACAGTPSYFLPVQAINLRLPSGQVGRN